MRGVHVDVKAVGRAPGVEVARDVLAQRGDQRAAVGHVLRDELVDRRRDQTARGRVGAERQVLERGQLRERDDAGRRAARDPDRVRLPVRVGDLRQPGSPSCLRRRRAAGRRPASRCWTSASLAAIVAAGVDGRHDNHDLVVADDRERQRSAADRRGPAPPRPRAAAARRRGRRDGVAEITTNDDSSANAGRAGGIEARARFELAAGEQVLEQVAPDPLAGGRELLLGLEVDLGGVRGRDLEVAGEV